MRQVSVRLPRVRLAVSVVLVAILLSGCSAIRQAEFVYEIDRMIANAKSPADHEAIAAAYDKEAARNREEAAAHMKIAQSYEARPRFKFDYYKICRQMAGEYTNLAREDDELAAEHRMVEEKMRANAAGSASP